MIWLFHCFSEITAKDTHISKDGLREKKLWTNHSKSNHSKKDAETKDVQNDMSLNKGFWELEAMYKSVKHRYIMKKKKENKRQETIR